MVTDSRGIRLYKRHSHMLEWPFEILQWCQFGQYAELREIALLCLFVRRWLLVVIRKTFAMLVPANTIMSSGLFRIPFIFALIFILYSLHSFTRTPSRIFDSDFRDARPPLRSKNVLEDAPLNVRVHHQKLDSLHLQIPKESASLGSKSKTSIAGVRRGLTTPASDTALSDLLLTTSTPKHGISQQGIVQPKYSRLDPTNKKIILFWTRFFRKDNIHLHDNLENCTINTCFLTKNRSYLNRSAAIIFHQRDMHLHWHDLPPHRQPHQVYVFFFLESADFSTGWGEGVDLKQPQWMNFFNLTFTYRTDSDVYCPAYTHLIYNPQLWSDRAKFRETVERKKNRALLFNSHCKTPGRREDYYNELGKHFPVDVVGKCGKRVCEPDFMVDIVSGCRNPPCRANSSDCEQRLTESYKFYLAFENRWGLG